MKDRAVLKLSYGNCQYALLVLSMLFSNVATSPTSSHTVDMICSDRKSKTNKVRGPARLNTYHSIAFKCHTPFSKSPNTLHTHSSFTGASERGLNPHPAPSSSIYPIFSIPNNPTHSTTPFSNPSLPLPFISPHPYRYRQDGKI